MKTQRAMSIVAALMLTMSSAQSHDTWIMPSAFRLPIGQAIAATMSAGDGLAAQSAPRQQFIDSVELIDISGRRKHDQWHSQTTKVLLSFPAPAAGVSLLAVTTKEREIVIEPDTVDQYLAEIHAGADIVDAWKAQRARGEAWTERYAKDAKTYLRSGSGHAGWPQLATLGQVLEIVALQDPTALKTGDRLEVALKHKGAPAAGVPLRLHGGKGEVVVRTNDRGVATFTLTQSGAHLLATTVLHRPEGPGQPWTSRFVTFGFGVDE